MNEDLEKELGSEEVEKVNREELKEVEQEMIIRELEATENQLKVKILFILMRQNLCVQFKASILVRPL